MKKVLQGEVNEPLFNWNISRGCGRVAFSPDGERLAVAAGQATERKGK